MSCNICNSGKKGIRWTKDLNDGKVKVQDACIEFAMNPEEVYEHLSTHEMLDIADAKIDITSIIDDPTFFYRELYDLFSTMKDWLNFTMEVERLDRTTIQTGLNLIKEIRETLKLIAELQGKISKGNTYQIQYNQIHGDFNTLIGVVLSIACEKCQREILKAMDDKKLLSGGNSGKKKDR